MEEIKISSLISDKISGEWGSDAQTTNAVNVIRTTNFTNSGAISFDNIVKREIRKNLVEKKKLINGDIIIEKSGGSPNQPVGRVVYFESPINETYVCNNFTTVLRPAKHKVNPKYLFYLLYNSYNTGRVMAFQNKTTGIINLKLDRYLDIKISYEPNLEIQNKIVAILDKAKAILDKREETIAKYDELKWSYFYNKFKAWKFFEQKTVEEIASDKQYSLSSGPFGSNLTSKDYINEPGVLILRGKNITSGKLDLSDIKHVSNKKAFELKRSEIKPRDIVIVAVGLSGKALKIPYSLNRAIISQNFNKVTCNENLINPTFFEYCFNSTIVQYQLKSIITDAGRTFLSLTNIKEVKIPIPTIQLQNEFETFIEKADNLIAKLTESKIRVEHLVYSISQLAFNGELKFNTAVDLEVLLENNYVFFKNNSNSESIKLLLERLDKDEFNDNAFYEQEIYDKAKGLVFELLNEGKIKQVFDEKTKSVKLSFI